MDLKIDFNNPNLLRGYLEEALPQLGLEDALEDVKKRIIVGKNGGLAHCLFSASELNLPREPRMSSLSEIRALTTCFGAIEDYLGAARDYAQEFDFQLVVNCRDKGIIPVREGANFYFSTAGIGDESIKSLEEFERFLQMVIECREDLIQRYNAVKEAIKNITYHNR